MAENNRDLNKLKDEARDLGVDFAGNIGYATLSERVRKAKEEKEKLIPKKPKKLTEKQVKKMVATSLSKVIIRNLDKENTSATTVFSGVHNMQLDLARVVPLNMEIALEEVLIQDIENRRMLISEPVIDKHGNKTGNFKIVEAPSYAVTRL